MRYPASGTSIIPIIPMVQWIKSDVHSLNVQEYTCTTNRNKEIKEIKSNAIWNFDKEIPGVHLNSIGSFVKKISGSYTLYNVYNLEFFSQNC